MAPWDFVFADEVHRLKGGSNVKPTLIWQVMKDVCSKARFIYFLSGTPIVNKGEEMWAYLNIFAPEQFPSVKNFMYKFMDAEYDLDSKIVFTVNVNRLMNALEGQMIHRTKLEVGMELPDKTRMFEYLDMEGKQRAAYDQMRDNLFVYLDNADDKMTIKASVIIAQINRLRQIALYPKALKLEGMDGRIFEIDCDECVKIDRAEELVEEINEQVVIFSSQFNPPLFELKRRLEASGKSVALITGGSSDRTDEFERAFQQGEYDVLMINMRTGTEGLNLHKSPEYWPGGASHAIFLDLWWNPALNVQAEDRIWRDGCKEPVTIHILQCEDSADQFVADKVQKKEDLVNSIMGRAELRPPSEWRELLSELI
jgi:SNF2 family DNA or RNA helicase